MKKPWSFIENPFLNATAKSYRLANRISNYHDAALQAASGDPFMLTLYNLFHPLHLLWTIAYNSWVAQGGMQKGKTQSLKSLLDELSSKRISKWMGAIVQVYPKGSAGYLSLLPQDSGPFQNGTQADKVGAVQSLSNALNGITPLSSLRTEIDGFYLLLDTAYHQQKGSKSTTGNMSDSVEAARIAIGDSMYENLGSLMKHFATDRDRITHFFDLPAIRHGQQVLFTGHVKMNNIHLIAKHKCVADEKIMLENTGYTSLQFYFADAKNAHVTPTAGITLAPGTHLQVPGSSLGNPGDAYLLVFNPDSNLKGEFTVEFV